MEALAHLHGGKALGRDDAPHDGPFGGGNAVTALLGIGREADEPALRGAREGALRAGPGVEERLVVGAEQRIGMIAGRRRERAEDGHGRESNGDEPSRQAGGELRRACSTERISSSEADARR